MFQSFGIAPEVQFESDECLRFHDALSVTSSLTGICNVVSLISKDNLQLGNVMCVIHGSSWATAQFRGFYQVSLM